MLDDRWLSALHQKPSAIPVSFGILPAAWMKYRDELSSITNRYPQFFGVDRDRDYDAVGGTYVSGEHIDAWGCVWSNLKTGQESIVTKHPYPTRESVRNLKAPETDIGFPHGFMYLRLADLRGFEELMMDFAEDAPELQKLIDVVRDYNVRQASLLLPRFKERSFVFFGDDLGMQLSLAMSPEKWRQYLKPCFMAIYEPFVKADHLIYMHTDGHILEVIPDLKDCGVTVVNPQIRANGIDGLVDVCKGKICVDLDLDRQLFPFASVKDIDEHVKECVSKLGSDKGGLWLKIEIGDDVPLEIVEALCASAEKYRFMYS
jgi:hypothetical protein